MGIIFKNVSLGMEMFTGEEKSDAHEISKLLLITTKLLLIITLNYISIFQIHL